jgi:16S rRNA (cytosine1402-N4)-methyltransferase
MWTSSDVHVPVLLTEVIDALRVRAGGVYVDGTFGAGGYSHAVLAAADCHVYGIDRDLDAIARGRDLELAGPIFTMLAGRFGAMRDLLADHSVEQVDGIVLDLGLSSLQLADAGRGFSFQSDGPLDMRMGTDEPGDSAADLVNTRSAVDLARILREFGEEPAARRIARAIVERRRAAPFERTGDLAAVVARAVARPRGRTHPATRTFQALRIAVNDELAELDDGLNAAEQLLAPGGRLVVVSFHSLEDRRVKRFLSERSGRRPQPSRHLPPAPASTPRFHLLTTRPIMPATAEVNRNPRARSARLRAAERLDDALGDDASPAGTWLEALAA